VDARDKLPVLGKYRTIRELGKGAMGVVYEGRDCESDRRVAIKMVRGELLADIACTHEIRERFLREAHILAGFNHPNIVSIFDVGEQNGDVYIVMEYLEGRNLARILEERGCLSPAEAVDICATICAALELVHARGIIHRDVKPENIFIADSGTIRLVDFGVAHTFDSSLTRLGTVIGTHSYMSPEQVAGKQVDKRSDLWSIGVVLYELITGRKPFSAETSQRLTYAIINTNPVEPQELDKIVGGTLSGVIMRSLGKDPDKRFQSAAEMAEALRNAMPGSESAPEVERTGKESMNSFLARTEQGERISAATFAGLPVSSSDDETMDGAIGVHGAICVIDVDRYNSDMRSDRDRANIRQTLRSIIGRALVAVVQKVETCSLIDIGDGIASIFPPDAPKAKLITTFVPTIENLLIEHNNQCTDHPARQIRLRLALHFGEFLIDEYVSKQEGVLGAEINHAFRLVDSDILREFVRSLRDDRPLGVLISDKFYHSIVCQQVPTLKEQFKRVEILGKDGSLEAFLMSNQSSDRTPILSRPTVIARRKEETTLAQLEESRGTCIYLSTSDFHNYGLYRRAAHRVPLLNHLETALFLGAGTIIHCVDPYRMEEVCKLLEEFSHFVESGQILFLLGRQIQDARRDFLPYIERKSAQYLESGYGADDIESLNPPVAAKNPERVIDLLDRSPFVLHRGYEGTGRFIEAVTRDFIERETMVVTSELTNSKLSNVNLTLFQILTLKQVSKDGAVKRIVASDAEMSRIQSELYQRIEQESFSRRILLDIIRKNLTDSRLDRFILDLLETRINLLHLSINVGNHAFIELRPNRDKNSPYFYKPLLNHLGLIANRAPKERIGADLLGVLMKHRSSRTLASFHLRVMADLYARRMGDMEAYPDRFCTATMMEDGIEEIRNLVSEYWI